MGLTPHEFERRLLMGTIGLCLLGLLIMLICVSTDYWIYLDLPGGQWHNKTEVYRLGHHSGLWKICQIEWKNDTEPAVRRESCRLLKFYPSNDVVNRDPEVDYTILNYSRAETAFAIIAVVLMAIGLAFSFYAFMEPRYMFKRLAGFMHIITAVSILVSAEVMNNSVKYEDQWLPARHPQGAHYYFGFSYYLAWVSFVLYVIAGIIFIWTSRKRKGAKAHHEREAMENEPVHIGRI